MTSRFTPGLTAVALALFGLLPLLSALVGAPRSDENLVVRLGMAFALVGFGLMTLQFLLSSRFGLVTNPVGLAQMLRWHRITGILAVSFLLVHPLMVSLGDGKPELLNPFRSPWPVVLGQAALLLLLIHITAALLRPKLTIDYIVWRRIHKGAYLIFTLGFVHSFAQGDDLKSHALQLVWIILLCVIGGFFFHRHFARPRRLRRNAYRVVELVKETHDTTTVILAPAKGAPFSYLPGQFMFITPQAAVIPKEEHPFTISSSPARGQQLSATIKSSGDFTAQMPRLRAGDSVLVDGPYGNFSFQALPYASKFVFIAAGVGITPFMSMLRALRDTEDRTPCLLIYGNRTEADIIFRAELDEMESAMHLRVLHVLSRPSSEWKGERGRVGRELLVRCTEGFRKAAFYVCGPCEMMKSTIAELKSLGIDPARIHSEEFSL